MGAGGVLAALLLFEVKHYLADFQWQTLWMVRTKGRYGHVGGLVHAGLHGVLSVPVLLLMAAWMPTIMPTGLLVGLVIAEGVIHYHIDWLKARVAARRGIDEGDRAYWHLLGLDQAAHRLTYLGMAAVLVVAG